MTHVVNPETRYYKYMCGQDKDKRTAFSFSAGVSSSKMVERIDDFLSDTDSFLGTPMASSSILSLVIEHT